jgi:hypothetical protein
MEANMVSGAGRSESGEGLSATTAVKAQDFAWTDPHD